MEGEVADGVCTTFMQRDAVRRDEIAEKSLLLDGVDIVGHGSSRSRPFEAVRKGLWQELV